MSATYSNDYKQRAEQHLRDTVYRKCKEAGATTAAALAASERVVTAYNKGKTRGAKELGNCIRKHVRAAVKASRR